MAGLQPPMPQVVLGVLTAVVFAAVSFIPSFRHWTNIVSIRTLVAWHLWRLAAGGYFLFLARQSSLAPGFALPAGIGDIAVALFAAVLLLTTDPKTSPGRRGYAVWNFAGLLDIVFVVVNAARTGLADPASMAPLLRLPLSILPTFLVPTIFVTHFILIRRLTLQKLP
jgi:hypothetical protein